MRIGVCESLVLGLFFLVWCLIFSWNHSQIIFEKFPKVHDFPGNYFLILVRDFPRKSRFLGFYGCAHVYMRFYIGFHRVSCIPMIPPRSWLGNPESQNVVKNVIQNPLKEISHKANFHTHPTWYLEIRMFLAYLVIKLFFLVWCLHPFSNFARIILA